jgi:hypothetical protein
MYDLKKMENSWLGSMIEHSKHLGQTKPGILLFRWQPITIQFDTKVAMGYQYRSDLMRLP